MKSYIVVMVAVFVSLVYSQDDIPARDRPRVEGDLPSLTVSLREGWNMISINVSPPEQFWMENEDRGPDVVLMTEQLRIDERHHHIIMMKNEDGLFYAPRWGFNNIPFWNLTEGYRINVDEDVEATWFGERIPPNADIPLEEGWNVIPYYPRYRLDASAPNFYVLSRIIDHVFIAKDGAGHFLSPRFNFSSMLPWRESQGYQIRVTADCVLNYPPEREINAISVKTYVTPIEQSLKSDTEPAIPNEYFLSEAYPNPFNATVHLNYGLPEAVHVSLQVNDIAGRVVETLINQDHQAGHYTAIWNPTGRDACATASGIYFMRMSAGEFGSVRKVSFVK
ncbi:MAG: T9SS type A sorting domain-containing protein [Calditrichaeota bacterium]|nr:T9SS type A sorting domain-containing protein [Calditrichota bacterium]MBT7790328.1 T9SS type A sorting domain-containing protein [Calditrichota bacterium]